MLGAENLSVVKSWLQHLTGTTKTGFLHSGILEAIKVPILTLFDFTAGISLDHRIPLYT